MSGFAINPNGEILGIVSAPFWPPIDLNEFKNQMRVGGAQITEIRMKSAIINAILHCQSELIDEMARWQNEGNATLGMVDCMEIDNQSIFVFLFKRAVFCIANAELIETHPDISATKDGLDQSNAILPIANELRYQAKSALRQIKGGDTKISRLI